MAGSDQFLRAVLARYARAAPAQMRFTRQAQGKPVLAAPVLPLDFNLSDSGDWLAMVVSDGAAVGIDLEYCDSGRDVLKLARRFFSAAELADLQACSAAERISRFYDYWTLKEAHIKAAGGSLGRELETTGFALQYSGASSGSGGMGSILSLAPAPAAPARYCLLQPSEGYRLALCCDGPLDFTRGLRLFELTDGNVAVEREPALRAVSPDPDFPLAVACP